MLNVEMTLILGMEIDADCVLVDIHLPGWMLTGMQAIFLSVQEQRINFVQIKRGCPPTTFHCMIVFSSENKRHDMTENGVKDLCIYTYIIII